MKSKQELLNEIEELENDIKTGMKFAKQGYDCDTILSISNEMLIKAKIELQRLS